MRLCRHRQREGMGFRGHHGRVHGVSRLQARATRSASEGRRGTGRGNAEPAGGGPPLNSVPTNSWPNNRLQATANSLRSFLAAAIGGA